MSDSSAGSTSPRGSRLRWAVLGVALLLVATTIWRSAVKSSAINRARQVQVGQSYEEVLKLLGEPQFSFDAGEYNGEAFSDMPSLEIKLRILIQNTFGVGAFPDLDEFTVRISYDENGRVRNIMFPH